MDIQIPGIGSLRQTLEDAQVVISLPSDAEARLGKDDQGYSFTWECCFYQEDQHFPAARGMSFETLIEGIFSLLFNRMETQD
jgi:hypothetical protein